MPGIVEFPTVVQQAGKPFGDVFANEPERQHFGEYLTGLLVVEKKTGSPGTPVKTEHRLKVGLIFPMV